MRVVTGMEVDWLCCLVLIDGSWIMDQDNGGLTVKDDNGRRDNRNIF